MNLRDRFLATVDHEPSDKEYQLWLRNRIHIRMDEIAMNEDKPTIGKLQKGESE